MADARRILYVVTFDATEAAISWQVAELARPGMRRDLARLDGVAAGSSVPIVTPRNRTPAVAIAARMKGYVADIRVAEVALPEAACGSRTKSAAELIVIGPASAPRASRPMPVRALKIARDAHQDV